MAKRIAVSTLNASTIDILNAIRQNAGLEYQDKIPLITDEKQIPMVGEVLYGYPALANRFLNQLVNRIALVRVKSATFNNAYAQLKKGFLEYGETVEEVFVQIAKGRDFSPEKAARREFARTIPDVKSAFHAVNFFAQYPITIQEDDLNGAFLSADGLTDFIANLIKQVYTAAEYDEYLCFKYLMIKAITHGQAKPIYIGAENPASLDEAAISFRKTSSDLGFIRRDFNESGVLTNTARDDQFIFMDSDFNARFDVKQLSSAFHMEYTNFMGHLLLIDSWETFDNDRFSEIRESGQMELVTPQELALMRDVKAVLADREWFQVYDKYAKMKSTEVASGDYWNYFYNVKKVFSHSPFSNFVVFVSGNAPAAPTTPGSYIGGKDKSEEATVLNLQNVETDPSFTGGSVTHIQTEEATTAGIAVQPYGSYIMPEGTTTVTPEVEADGVRYRATAPITPESNVSDTVSFTKVEG